MTVVITTSLFTISSLENEVILRVENRTDDVARARIWLRDTLLEITSNPDLRSEFDELEVTSAVFNLTANQQEYPFSSWVTAPDINVASLSMLLWTDPPANTTRIKLTQVDYQYGDMITPRAAQPVQWYRYGDTCGFVAPPNKAYQTQLRWYRMHPIDDASLQDTEILISRDWNEILVWGAAMRGFMELLEFEKAAKLRVLLYGDPKYPDRPGLINARKKRKEKEAWRRQRTLRPVVRDYGFR